jgi:hypothetical protein
MFGCALSGHTELGLLACAVHSQGTLFIAGWTDGNLHSNIIPLIVSIGDRYCLLEITAAYCCTRNVQTARISTLAPM